MMSKMYMTSHMDPTFDLFLDYKGKQLDYEDRRYRGMKRHDKEAETDI